MEAERKPGVVLDEILANEVGQFGKFQLVTLIFAAFPIIFSSFATSEYIFTTARINTRCHIKECDATDPEFTPPWLLNAVPGSNITSFESCERYSNVNNITAMAKDACPASQFNQSLRQDCEAYVYENQFSVVYDFNLGCNEWRRAWIGSIRMAGTLFGLPITGYISDRWGRRVALSLNAFNLCWTGLIRSFVNSYEWFVALEVLETVLGSGVYSSCYVLVLELAGPKYRVAAGGVVDTIYAFGLMILGLTAWVEPAWRPLTQILYAPQIIVVFYYFVLSESVRWLISRSRYEETEQILKKVARINQTELSENSLRELRLAAEAEKNASNSKEPWLRHIFKSRAILHRCLVSPIWWCTNILVYFGMNINAVDLVGNKYLNFIAVSAIDIPGIWTVVLLLDRIGRKPVIISGYWLCAVCQFAFAFLPEDFDGFRPALYFFGKYFISVVITSVYIYTAELYPTKCRHRLLALSSTIGRLGFIVAPLTPALALTVWKPLPAVLFGGSALLSGALIFTTPETLGTKLPDTFEEAEQLGIKKSAL